MNTNQQSLHTSAAAQQPLPDTTPASPAPTSGASHAASQAAPASHAAGQGSIRVQSIHLPQGGGAIRGIGETFQANPFSGTAGLSVPILASPCRDLAPQLQLAYSTGSGNGPWGMGWSLALPNISRQTRKGTPQYKDTDVFVLSGAADLVPLAQAPRTAELQATTYTIRAYRPRQEEAFALIEYWQPQDGNPADAFWKVTDKAHTVSIYGKTAQAKIADPANSARVFTWLLEESYNAQGDHQLCFYKREDTENVAADYEQGHVQTANCYLERIWYGNKTAIQDALVLTDHAARTDPSQWHFEVVFDYGEYDLDPSNGTPYTPVRKWKARPDPFSTYHAGFEIRTHRLCYHTLMFHRFQDELGDEPVLVHATAYEYQPNYAHMSECVSVTNTGYTYDPAQKTYTKAALPPLSLQYTPFQPTGHDFVPLTTTQAQTLQGLDNPPHHTLVDLFGEGIPGILYTDGASTYYRNPVLSNDTATPPTSAAPGVQPLSNGASSSRNVHYAAWQPLNNFPLPKRVADGPGITLQDINGNGQLDVVMAAPTAMCGYWEAQPDRSWRAFQAFEAWPSEYPAPSQTWVDMTGDGIADLVQLTAQEVRVYPSARSQGLGAAIVQQNQGLPPSLAGSPTEVVQFADMAGSGQAHLVRIRNKEVVYWPNLSYGRLGEAITMAHAPDFGEDFNSARLFLADLDGSGTTDLIYMEPTRATIYFNQSGNAFSDPVVLKLPFAFDALDQVTFADVYGRGNACLVISEPYHLPDPKHWCYDFCQGQKPYLLNQLANNLGATTAITYGSSVDFYLQDKKESQPWITALPFPVQVVTQITHTDAIAGTRYVSQYAYHHGYYDGVEREFRGFGRVDRQDSEYFPPSKIDPDKQPEYVAPSLSRTWYHTGAYRAGAALSRQYASEYYPGDKQAFAFPDSPIDWGDVDPDEETQRQAAVAMAGTVLRTELYGLDDNAPAAHPYSVSESNFRVVLKQDKGENPYAIFYVHPQHTLTYTYERDPQDPQIHQETTLQVDDYGNVERSCAISYPRRVIPTASASLAQEALKQGQGQARATLALHAYANKTTPAEYLLGVAVESQSYELSSHLQKIYQSGKPFTLQAVKQLVDGIFRKTTPTPLNLPPAGVPLLSWERLYYAQVTAKGTTDKLPLGQVALPLLLFEHHVAEFSKDQVAAAFQDTPLKDDALTAKLQEGYYQLDTTSNYWWNPGLTEHYFGAAQFYLPQATVDPAGNKTQYSYDTYHLLLTEVKDALNNTVQATAIDYQHLHPRQLIDANGNTSEVKLDPLGRVVYTSHYGHEAGKPQGFAPLSKAPTATPSSLQDILAEPAKYLGKTQSYFYYDPFAWQKHQTPVWSLALVAEQYPDSTKAPAPIQIHLTYNDGLGRNLCTKSQVEPGEAFLYDAQTGKVTQGTTQDRWLTTGRTVYNNKGNPVKQYEPYYIDTPAYVSHATLDTFGVSPTLYYDPLDRPIKVLTAKGFWTTHTWTAWEEAVYDQNDTLQDSPYYQANITKPDPNSPFYDPELSEASKQNLAYVAQHFADTPRRSVLDNLGNTIVEERINQSADKPKGEILQTHHTYDILGRELTSADPRLSAAGKHNFQTTYSLVGDALQVISADAGTRWALTNTWGNLIWAYDERQITITTTYDALQRPTQVHKPATDQDPLALDQVVERFIYGDTPKAVTDPAQHNLRGQLYQHYDPAGLVTTPSYSLLGAPLQSQRQFRVAYQVEADWHDISPDKVKELLQPTTYTEKTSYDALGRITQETDADGNQTAPQYHISGRLKKITLTPKDDGQAVQVVKSITYNAKSQREQITYGNTTTTTYSYDPKTWAVTRIKTENSQGKKLQDLSYVYDPVENVVQKTDAAEEPVFYDNQKVEATATYTYDSLYRLLKATGREKAGVSEAMAGREIPIVTPSPHVHDHQALQNYVERYSYDAGNNLTQTQHTAGQKSWTRTMVVSDTSNRAVLSTINGQDHPAPTPDEVDQYFDKHGNQIQTQQLHLLAWDYRDNLQRGTVVERSSGKHDAEYYVYDGRGQRVRKVNEQYGEGAAIVTLQETLYLGHLEHRRTLQGADIGSATVTKEYHSLRVLDDRQCVATRDHWVQGSPPSGFQNPTLRYHLDDHLGSCTVEVDTQGKQISREEYSPYGSSTLFMGTGIASQLKHYRYSGQERDSVTGFYYYGARYYAPWLCRWLSPDPAGTVDGLNIYAFVSDDPETFWDVGGRGLDDYLNIQRGNRAIEQARKIAPYPGNQEFSVIQTRGESMARLDIQRTNFRAGNFGDDQSYNSGAQAFLRAASVLQCGGALCNEYSALVHTYLTTETATREPIIRIWNRDEGHSYTLIGDPRVTDPVIVDPWVEKPEAHLYSQAKMSLSTNIDYQTVTPSLSKELAKVRLNESNRILEDMENNNSHKLKSYFAGQPFSEPIALRMLGHNTSEQQNQYLFGLLSSRYSPSNPRGIIFNEPTSRLHPPMDWD